MHQILNNFRTAFSMFSRIPVGRASWSEENMKYMLCFFPLVGLCISGVMLLTGHILSLGSFAVFFKGALLAGVPLLVCGGIHADGLLDTLDALSAQRERKERLRILKDPHAGAFAVIFGCAYEIGLTACLVQIISLDEPRLFLCACLVFAPARCLSGLGVLSLPSANEGGSAGTFKKNAQQGTARRVLILELIAFDALLISASPQAGALAALSALALFALYRKRAVALFGGTSGDLSGYFLCLCEGLSLLVIALAGGFMA